MKLVVTSLLYVNCCGLLSNVKLIQGVVLRKSRLYCYESECLFSLSVQFVFWACGYCTTAAPCSILLVFGHIYSR